MDVRAETLQERKGTRIESLEMDKGGMSDNIRRNGHREKIPHSIEQRKRAGRQIGLPTDHTESINSHYYNTDRIQEPDCAARVCGTPEPADC